MKTTRWVIIDTETDGFKAPVHVVELAGQLMEGWEPVGEPFAMLLDHGVWIPPWAEAVHGYSQAQLRRHGREPRRVYEAFREYARDYPLVAHNLSYDWNRALAPEWARMGVPQVGRRGFCSMKLAQRLVHERKTHKLEELKEHFGLTSSRSHRGGNDVQTVVELFQQVFRARLEAVGCETYEAVASLAG